MLRPLLITAATVVAIWGTALGGTPVAMADPPDINCTQVNNDARCMYKNCTDAKADGRCNIRVGDPAYCPAQDFDHDGVACKCGTVNPGD
jgi:hypothetical protein